MLTEFGFGSKNDNNLIFVVNKKKERKDACSEPGNQTTLLLNIS